MRLHQFHYFAGRAWHVADKRTATATTRSTSCMASAVYVRQQANRISLASADIQSGTDRAATRRRCRRRRRRQQRRSVQIRCTRHANEHAVTCIHTHTHTHTPGCLVCECIRRRQTLHWWRGGFCDNAVAAKTTMAKRLDTHTLHRTANLCNSVWNDGTHTHSSR